VWFRFQSFDDRDPVSKFPSSPGITGLTLVRALLFNQCKILSVAKVFERRRLCSLALTDHGEHEEDDEDDETVILFASGHLKSARTSRSKRRLRDRTKRTRREADHSTTIPTCTATALGRGLVRTPGLAVEVVVVVLI
jgi:hypothetical protein